MRKNKLFRKNGIFFMRIVDWKLLSFVGGGAIGGWFFGFTQKAARN